MRVLSLAALAFVLGCAPGRSDAPHPIDPTLHADFVDSQQCAACHPRQVAEFAGSPKRYAAVSPVFNAMELAIGQVFHHPFIQGAVGQADNFCAGCHAPVAAARGLGSQSGASGPQGDAPLISRLRSPTEDGITCDYCHRVTGPDLAGSPLGDGIANVALHASPGATKIGPFPDAVANEFHHSTAVGGDYLQSPEFCGACHDVRIPVADAVTKELDTQGRPFSRLEDLFSEHRSSPWADPAHPQNPMRGQPGILGLHDARQADGEAITCQDCHMSLYPYRRLTDAITYDAHFAGVNPATLTRKAHKLYPAGRAAEPERALAPLPVRRVATHAFTAVSNPVIPFPTDLIPAPEHPFPDPALYGPDEPRDPVLAERRALAEVISRTGHEASCQGDTGAWGEPACALQRRTDMLQAALTLSLDETPAITERGHVLDIRAWIENVGASHNVPSGFSQEREVWVELTVLDGGRACTEDSECADLTEARRFFDDPRRHCDVHGPDGAPDPTLDPAHGRTWDGRMRAERSGRCDPDRSRCVLYRSGYLIDRDGDGRVHDEDLRHALIETDAEHLTERCVLPGPDADQRPTGIQQGLILFTNEFQTIELDEEGDPTEESQNAHLRPTAAPHQPSHDDPPVLDQPQTQRRSEHPTQHARYERNRYRTQRRPHPHTGDPRPGLPPQTGSPLEANRYHNANALRPFQPRLAHYAIQIPHETAGPLQVTARVRYRFFKPRLLRTLAKRTAGTPHALTEEMIDRYLTIIDLTSATTEVAVE